MIKAILANRGFRSAVKTARISSSDRFQTWSWRPHPKVGFVHLAAHASKAGIGLIGGDLTWDQVADKVKIVCPRLSYNQKRVLSLSCCHSQDGYEALQPLLKRHFTGCYFFKSEVIGFSDAMTVWAMFYKRKIISRPHGAVVERINRFLGEDVIQFDSI